jgi:hypothetical protein
MVMVAARCLKSVCVNSISKLSPGGTAENRPRDAILETLQPSLRDFIMLHDVPRTSVLG